MKHRTTAVEGLFEDVAEEWNQVESFAQFLMFSHKTDLESYIHLRRAVRVDKIIVFRMIYNF